VKQFRKCSAFRAQRSSRFQRGLPWGLGLHRPVVAISGGLSNGGMLAIRMIQNIEGYSALLDEAATRWTPTCLVHGDMRFDNCVLAGAGGPGRDATLKLVDWELAQWGDPCWDAGAVLGGYMSAWLLSFPISGETPLETVSHLGRFKFIDMQRAAGAFWTAYRIRMGASHDISLRRAMQFAAAHMIETMIEELQPSAVLTGRAVSLAQLAHNVLADPDAAADHFLVSEVTH
jgi:Phosphotransferase enzyme family